MSRIQFVEYSLVYLSGPSEQPAILDNMFGKVTICHAEMTIISCEDLFLLPAVAVVG